MKKAIVAIFILMMFVGCSGSTKTKEQDNLSEQENTEYKMMILNEDSSYLKEVELIIASNKTSFEEKRIDILLNIASHFMKKNEEKIKSMDGESCDNVETYICITQGGNFQDKNIFIIGYSNLSIFESSLFIPTRITTKNGRLVLMHFENEKPLTMNKIPGFLHFKNCIRDKNKDYILMIHGGWSWTVLMCKDSFKHIVGMHPTFETDWDVREKYFSNFSCDPAGADLQSVPIKQSKEKNE